MKLRHVFLLLFTAALVLWAGSSVVQAAGETYGAQGSEYQETPTVHTIVPPTSAGGDIAQTSARVVFYARQNVCFDRAYILPEGASAGMGTLGDGGTATVIVAKFLGDAGHAGAVFSKAILVDTVANTPVDMGAIQDAGSTYCATNDGGPQWDQMCLKSGETLRWYLTQTTAADLDGTAAAIHLQLLHHLAALNRVIQ